MSDGTDQYALNARVAELERKVEYLLQRAAAAEPAPLAHDGGVSPAVLELVRSGNKIGAIKRYREETGTDLRTAKDVVDRLG